MSNTGITIFTIWIISTVITCLIAKKKGQGVLGFVLGCIFGPLGIIIALISSNKKMPKDISEESKPILSEGDKKTFIHSPLAKKVIGTSVGFILAVSLFYSPGLRFSILDNKTDTFFSEAMIRAGVAYAACRTLNASVSVVKESHVAVSPFGIGISLALGQILDPIDDMTERVSDILVTSITSLGVQKLAYEIVMSLAPSMLAVLLLIASILIWFENEKIVSMRKLLMKIILLLIIARFALPVSAITNNYLQENFFNDKILKARDELAFGSDELDKLKDFSFPEIDGIRGTIKNSSSLIQKKSIEFKNAVFSTARNADNIIKNLLALSFLYVGVFIIQVIALPLLTFWVLVKITNSLFDTNIPTILPHSNISRNKSGQQGSSEGIIAI